jgi:ectoine hydroxylase-related dioxygenase (phytanoyl-CoA dioxygenase family)
VSLDANDRFTWSANLLHAAGENRSTGPERSVVSRTTTAPGDAPISTHSPPPFPL